MVGQDHQLSSKGSEYAVSNDAAGVPVALEDDRRAIESTFVTVRLRTEKTRGCVSRVSILSIALKLVRSAECLWRALCNRN